MAQQPTTVPFKTLQLITLFGGFWGAHKFALGAKREGYVYLCLSWAIFPAFASLLDLYDLTFRVGPNQPILKRPADQTGVVELKTIRHLTFGILILSFWIGISLWPTAA